MLDRSYYQLRKYMAANFKCDLGCPTIKTALEALDACNFIAAYWEIGKMISGRGQNAVVANMVVLNDPVMDIKLRACKCVLSLAEADQNVMDYAIKKNLDFACCSRSSYGDCLIGLFANIVPDNYDNTILEQIVKLSKAIYRTDYDSERIKEEFPDAFCFMKKCIKNYENIEDYKNIEDYESYKDYENYKAGISAIFLKKVQKDATVLENEWLL